MDSVPVLGVEGPVGVPLPHAKSAGTNNALNTVLILIEYSLTDVGSAPLALRQRQGRCQGAVPSALKQGWPRHGYCSGWALPLMKVGQRVDTQRIARHPSDAWPAQYRRTCPNPPISPSVPLVSRSWYRAGVSALRHAIGVSSLGSDSAVVRAHLGADTPMVAASQHMHNRRWR